MALLSILFGSFALLWLWSRITRKKHPPLPPGPPADPIIGHLRHMPKANPGDVFHEWGKKYGDVIYLNVLGKHTVILNSAEAAMDLLDKKSAIYSDRPPFPMFELMGWERSLALTGYGKIFQKHRRMLHHYFNENATPAYEPIQTQEARLLLQNILSDDTNLNSFLKRLTASIITRVGYGHKITSDDDPYVHITSSAQDTLGNSGSPGATPVDFLPILKYFPSWFPGAYYAGYARDHRPTVKRLYEYPFEEVKKQLAQGGAKPSFLSHQLEALDRDGPDGPHAILDIQGAAAGLYTAGADTTWATLSSFFLAMVLFPEFQGKAQKEIDSVIGTGRLPDFSDRGSLPYVDCIIEETKRWHSAVPLGIPHRLMEDDVYRGMFIPMGSLVIANIRAMSLDDKIYKNPHDFNPSRYLPEPEGNSEPYPTGPFGFGRRICPGQHLASATLWITIASVLSCFTISNAIGEDGKEIIPEISYSSGLGSHPGPFKCRVRPRNEQARRLIISADTSDNY